MCSLFFVFCLFFSLLEEILGGLFLVNVLVYSVFVVSLLRGWRVLNSEWGKTCLELQISPASLSFISSHHLKPTTFITLSLSLSLSLLTCIFPSFTSYYLSLDFLATQRIIISFIASLQILIPTDLYFLCLASLPSRLPPWSHPALGPYDSSPLHPSSPSRLPTRLSHSSLHSRLPLPNNYNLVDRNYVTWPLGLETDRTASLYSFSGHGKAVKKATEIPVFGDTLSPGTNHKISVMEVRPFPPSEVFGRCCVPRLSYGMYGPFPPCQYLPLPPPWLLPSYSLPALPRRCVTMSFVLLI